MSTFTLPNGRNQAFPIGVPGSGKVQFFLESEYPVTIMVMDETNFWQFRRGERYHYIYGLADTTQQTQGLSLWIGSAWYLVILNYGTQASAVHVNVWS